MPSDSTMQTHGIVHSVKRLASTMLEMAKTRLDLLANDLEQERAWISSMLLWTVLAIFSAMLAIVLLTLLIIMYFWESSRLLALSVLIALFILAATYAWNMVCKMARSKPRLFSASLEELAKDRSQLFPEHE